jgi:lactoylglutathione lyase
MPHSLTKLTPNLIVADTARSLAFYRDVLGFSLGMHVPDEPPFAFVSVLSRGVEIFLNAQEPALAEYPVFANRPIGATLTLFIEVQGVRELWESLRERVPVVLPLETKWYGLTEFAIADPDGYVLTFAERGA